MDWRPIEEAPHDPYKRILAANFSGWHCYWVYVAKWKGAGWWTDDERAGLCPTHFVMMDDVPRPKTPEAPQ